MWFSACEPEYASVGVIKVHCSNRGRTLLSENMILSEKGQLDPAYDMHAADLLLRQWILFREKILRMSVGA